MIEAGPQINAGPAYRPGSNSFVLIEAGGGFYLKFYGMHTHAQFLLNQLSFLELL